MHKHLTWTDRLKIEKALKEGLKPCKIADRLHVHNTTIYREIKRGTYTHLNSDLTTEERYSPEIAQQRYEEHLKAKGGELKIGNDYELAAFIEKKIGEEGYSPAAVIGEIKRLGLTFKTEISEKTIYNYIDKGVFYGISRESLPEKGSGNGSMKRWREESRPHVGGRKHRKPRSGNKRANDLRALGRRLRLRKEKDKGSLVRTFGAVDAKRNHYEDTGSDFRQHCGGAEQIGTPLRETFFTDIQKHNF